MDQLLMCSWPVAPVKSLMVAVEEEGLRQIVERNVVVVVGRRDCRMNYVAKKLLQGLMANPTMCKISERFGEKMALMDKIAKILIGDGRTLVPPVFPLVFIKGKLVGGLDSLITIYISVQACSHVENSWCCLALSDLFFLFFFNKYIITQFI